MVYIIEDLKGPDGKTYRGVRQQVVKIGESRGDRVAILSGVKPGEEVVTSGVFKLRPGVGVQVNNSIQPENSRRAETGGHMRQRCNSLLSTLNADPTVSID